MTRSWGTNSLALGTQVGAYGDRSSPIGDTNQVGLDMKDGSKSGKSLLLLVPRIRFTVTQAYAIGAGNTHRFPYCYRPRRKQMVVGAGADQDKITTVTDGTVKGNMSGASGYKNSITADNSYVVGSNPMFPLMGLWFSGTIASVTAKMLWPR